MSKNEKLYRLMFTGKLHEGFLHEDVADSLESMLKLPHEKAMKLIIGSKHYLSKDFSQADGERVMALVHDAGAECRLVAKSKIRQKKLKLPDLETPSEFEESRKK